MKEDRQTTKEEESKEKYRQEGADVQMLRMDTYINYYYYYYFILFFTSATSCLFSSLLPSSFTIYLLASEDLLLVFLSKALIHCSLLVFHHIGEYIS